MTDWTKDDDEALLRVLTELTDKIERLQATLREVEPFLRPALPYPERDRLHALVVAVLEEK